MCGSMRGKFTVRVDGNIESVPTTVLPGEEWSTSKKKLQLHVHSSNFHYRLFTENDSTETPSDYETAISATGECFTILKGFLLVQLYENRIVYRIWDVQRASHLGHHPSRMDSSLRYIYYRICHTIGRVWSRVRPFPKGYAGRCHFCRSV